MNKPLFNFDGKGNIIVKPLDNLKNKSGKYSLKNEHLVSILKKCLSLKTLGCNFIIDLEFGDDTYYKTSSKNFGGHDVKKVALEKDIANAITCLNLCLKDRCFIPTHNDKGGFMVTMLNHEKFDGVVCLVRDKNSVVNSTIEVTSVFNTEEKSVITLNTSKGLRLITEDEIREIITNFNAMLGLNFNKEIIKKVEKTA